MGRGFRAEMAMESTGSSSFPSLTFKKTGEEIRSAISARIGKNGDLTAAASRTIGEICKRREVKVEDVIDDDPGLREQKLSTYAENASGRLAAKTALEALQADIEQLRRESWVIDRVRRENADLARVHNNIETDRRFDLTFFELESLGF